MLLREAIFINGILTNVEASYGVTKENIRMLDKIDHILLRKVLSVPTVNHVMNPITWN